MVITQEEIDKKYHIGVNCIRTFNPFRLSSPIKRIGYKSFWGFVRILWQQNRIAKKSNIKLKFDIILPIK
jgi:hypothetical protein